MARKTISQWIQEACNDPDKDGKCTRFTLVHKQGVGDTEVHSTKLGDRQFTANELGSMFDGKARVYAQDLNGVQTFNLLAFYNDRTEPEARFPFLINSTPDAFASGLATEAPTAEGRTQQKMRHDEMLMQQVYKRQQQMDEHSVRLLDVLGTRVAALMHENAEAFTIVKELLAERETRQHELKMKEMEFERDSVERKKLLTFLPALLNTVLGRDIFPESTQDTALVEAVAEAIEPEEFEKLAGIIKRPELLGPLASRFQEILKNKREAKEEAKRTALALIEGGEAEAAGDVHGDPH